MGWIHAQEFADAVQEGLVDEDTALRWHLQINHYPPVHEVFLPVVKRALELARMDCWEVEVKLPNGKVLRVMEIVEQLHLREFL